MSDGAGDTQHFHHAPDPAMPGWWTWDIKDQARFNALLGPLHVRREPGAPGAPLKARLRMVPRTLHANLADGVHGGVVMAMIDIALFAACKAHDLFDVSKASTIDCSTQFLAPGRLDEPLDAVSEILRVTGRMVFLRGLVVQGDGDAHIVASYAATVRKPSSR